MTPPLHSNGQVCHCTTMVVGELDASAVRDLVRQGRIRQHHTWHGSQKHPIPFHVAATALSLCQRVVKDIRLGPDGKPRHPNGYVAWATSPTGALRIDFNLEQDADGRLLVLVTAMEVS